jgi:hypothetical protein
MVHDVPLRQKELMLLHKVTRRLNIHDDNKVFDFKWKEHDSQAEIK